MPQYLYLFNPENDMALANFTAYYEAPAEIKRMASDLSTLPAWYASPGSVVKVGSLSHARWLAEGCGAEGLLPAVRWSERCEDLPCRPWGWNPALARMLRGEGVSERYLPSPAQMERIRQLSGRQCGARLLGCFAGMPSVCGEAVACRSEEEVRRRVAAVGETILKAPWSGSGRGLVRVSPASWTASVAGWVSRILRVQGCVMAEPLYDKVCDFAMEFRVDAGKRPAFCGYSLFETDPHGNYKGNRLLPDSRIEKFLCRYVPAVLLHDVRRRLADGLAGLLGRGYEGYLGVDMMVCREGGSFLLHPCVELNLRMNMGVVSRIVYDRWVHPFSEGRYVVEHYPADGEALAAHHALCAAHPLQVCGGKVREGYLPLTPVCRNTRYQAYLVVEKAAGE